MKFLFHLLFLLCLPGIVWYAPLKAEIPPTFNATEDYSNFSPWELLKYETLSFDRILDFVEMIETTDNLEEIFTEAQMEEIEEFLIFLMRNGIRDWDIESKERLEEDIAWMRGEPNNSTLAEDEEEELPYWMSSFNGYHGMKILPAVLVSSKKPEIMLCKGKLKKVYKNVKRAVKRHKKEIIVAAVVVVVATVVIVATGGTGTPEAVVGGGAAIKAASDSKKDDDEKLKNPVNKPGEVYCRDDYEQPISQENSFQNDYVQNNTSVDRDFSRPQLEEVPKLIISDTTKEVVLKQTAEIKEELAEIVPDEAFNVMENEKHSFWNEVKDKTRETGSHIAHTVVDGTANTLESSGRIGWYLQDDYQEPRGNFDESFQRDVLPLADQLHQKIDKTFHTDYAGQYGSSKPSNEPQTMTDLLKDLGKDVAFCFVPVPGSQLNKVSKIAKTSKAVVEAAKAAGIVQATAEVAAIGSTLTKPIPEQLPTIQETKEIQLVPREQGNINVYQSVDESNGGVQYVGITNNIPRRQIEHAKTKGIDIAPIEGLTNLTKYDAKAVEQVLIQMHGLEKNGGTLMNKINSIAKTNPEYAASLKRGAEILQEAGLSIE
jgi:predicted GIY-YIG superfamily endonuclease